MRKYISVLLCLALMIGLALPVGTVAAADDDVKGVVVEALRAPLGLDVTSPITSETWGKPVIHVDKNSPNTSFHQYNALPDGGEMDIYIAWDDDNLYIGVVSPDTDLRGSADSWVGDGIQFKISTGEKMSSDALGVYFTLGEDNKSVTAGDSCEKYEKSIHVVDGKLYCSVAVPFSDLGMLKGDIKNGALLSFSILRISGTAAEPYAGWLAWGAFFGANNGNNPECYADNVIVLSNKTVESKLILNAEKLYGSAPDMKAVINEATWGRPVVHVNKDTFNATLKDYEAKAEDCEMDIYTLWDEKCLYLGITSPDLDARGSKDSWVGDGIQFKIAAGNDVDGTGSKNIYFTLGEDNVSMTAGDSCKDYDKNIQVVDGKMYCTIAIPLADLGLMASDIKVGLELAFAILRISGTTDNSYAGWLAYGAFFGPDSDNNANSKYSNVIVFTNKPVEAGVVYKSDKLDDELSVNEPITDEKWGKPVASLNKDSYNASLFRYNADPTDVTMDVYIRWNEKYTYLGVVSPDSDLRGDSESYMGDGIQFKISAGKTMTSDALNLYFTLSKDNKSVVCGNSCADMEKNILYVDGKLHMMIAIPNESLGVMEADVKSGTSYSLSLLRISGTSEHAYAGWLAWGAFFGVDNPYNKDCVGDNVIVLYDENASAGGEEEFESLLTNITQSANSAMAEYGVKDGNKIIATEKGVYVLYVTRAQVIKNKKGSAVNEFSLQFIDNDKTVKELAYGYSYNGVQDIVMDKDGNVYVVAGSSSWDVKSLSPSLTDYKTKDEEAILDIWKYNEKTGILNGYTVHRKFAGKSANGYEYAASVIDEKTGKIYTVYKGNTNDSKYAFAYFTFDIASKKWEAESKSVITSEAAEKVYAYVNADDLAFVYGSEKSVYSVSKGEEKKIADGKLSNVYVAGNGTVYALYAAAGNISISSISGGDVKSGSTDVTENCIVDVVEVGGKLYVVSLNTSKAAEVTVRELTDSLSLGEGVNTKLDNVVVPYGVVMASVKGDSISIMSAGKRGTVMSWYYNEVAVAK